MTMYKRSTDFALGQVGLEAFLCRESGGQNALTRRSEPQIAAAKKGTSDHTVDDKKQQQYDLMECSSSQTDL